jgi:hypothetical protein
VRTPLGLQAKAWSEPLSDLTMKPKTAVVEPVSRAPLHADQVVAVGDLRVGDLASVSPGHRRSCPDEPGPHRTAFLTSAAIFFSSAGVNSSSAKEVGHILPSSRFAASWKPNVEYLDLY